MANVELVEHLGSGLNRILKAYDRESFVLKENFMFRGSPKTGGYYVV